LDGAALTLTLTEVGTVEAGTVTGTATVVGLAEGGITEGGTVTEAPYPESVTPGR